MHDIHLPPPRSGDYSSVNRHLTAGGTVEGIPRENPYQNYYLQLMKKRMKKTETKFVLLKDVIIPAGTVLDSAPTNRGGELAVEAIIGMGKDSTAYFHMSVLAIEDAPKDLIALLQTTMERSV